MKHYITKKGEEKLLSELQHLRNETVPRLSEEIEKARAHGDLSENAEYHAAKEDLARAQKRIAEIRNILASSILIDEEKMSSEKVYLGCRVVLESDLGEIEYEIVSPVEADSLHGKISSASPIGSALIGKSKGDFVEIMTPSGSKKFKIKEISRG